MSVLYGARQLEADLLRRLVVRRVPEARLVF
jgi:hypothetical protein